MANRKKMLVENVEQADGGFATVHETADYLGLSRAKIYNLMDAKEIPFAKFGSARRIPWAAVKAYGERCMVEA